jgi:hypothetical protein
MTAFPREEASRATDTAMIKEIGILRSLNVLLPL